MQKTDLLTETQKVRFVPQNSRWRSLSSFQSQHMARNFGVMRRAVRSLASR